MKRLIFSPAAASIAPVFCGCGGTVPVDHRSGCVEAGIL